MVHIRYYQDGSDHWKKIYGTDIRAETISEWTHHVVYFEKSQYDRTIFAEAADSTVDIWMDNIYVGPSDIFDDCHRVDIDSCQGIFYLFIFLKSLF